MLYFSSRGSTAPVTAAQAITKGIAPDGGLFVPERVPAMDDNDWAELLTSDYKERARFILGRFLEDFTNEQLTSCVARAYNDKNFDDPHIAPLVKLNDKLYIQELWHGPTCAFKDMALQILPHLLTTSMAITDEKQDVVILVATSGDTGKAALEGFRDVDRTRIIVFYPDQGVSEVQKRQMITQEGGNVSVAAVDGNFDDAQSGVKRIFADQQLQEKLLEHGLKLSSANSINWGRLVPQIVYYVSAYAELLKQNSIQRGQAVNFVVPTGNFGNILAAFYAMRMGVPINRLICASNANNVLTEFIRTGVYNRNRTFEKTVSPSMDILISSNLERLLFELTGHDGSLVGTWMKELQETGCYQVDEVTRGKVQSIFWGDYCGDEETLATIRSTWEKERYLLDTHTAVAVKVYKAYQEETGDTTPAIIASTASPFKFGNSVAGALFNAEMIAGKDEFELLKLLSTGTGVPIPAGIQGLEKRPVLHQHLTAREDMNQTVLSFLNIK